MKAIGFALVAMTLIASSASAMGKSEQRLTEQCNNGNIHACFELDFGR